MYEYKYQYQYIYIYIYIYLSIFVDRCQRPRREGRCKALSTVGRWM